MKNCIATNTVPVHNMASEILNIGLNSSIGNNGSSA